MTVWFKVEGTSRKVRVCKLIPEREVQGDGNKCQAQVKGEAQLALIRQMGSGDQGGQIDEQIQSRKAQIPDHKGHRDSGGPTIGKQKHRQSQRHEQHKRNVG